MIGLLYRTIWVISAHGTAALVVEQNANMALPIANPGYVLQTGRVVLADEAAALHRNPAMRKTYLGET